MNFAPVELDDELRALQADVRAFCDEHLTDEVREELRRRGDGHDPDFSFALGERGWLYPDWPVDRGGAGLDALHAAVLNFELARARPPRSSRNTTAIVVGAIEAFGSAEMKAAVLPGVARGVVTMCLGWTEPGSGSDIAAAACRASREGDDWVINGKKSFITGAHFCTYVFLLARTDPDAPKHRGLTMFLVPMDSHGIEVQPIMTYSEERANVVVFDGVRVDDRWRLGEVNGGWTVLSKPLGQEHGEDPNLPPFRRDVLGYTAQLHAALDEALKWAQAPPRSGGTRPIDDPVVRVRLARSALACIVGPEAPLGPMRRVLGSDLLVDGSCDLADLVGPEALLERGEQGAVGAAEIGLAYRTGPATTIYGGTTDIHRSVIAERMGLPRSRRP